MASTGQSRVCECTLQYQWVLGLVHIYAVPTWVQCNGKQAGLVATIHSCRCGVFHPTLKWCPKMQALRKAL